MNQAANDFLETNILRDVIVIPHELYSATGYIIERICKLNYNVVYHLEDSSRGRILHRISDSTFAIFYLAAIIDVRQVGTPFLKFAVKSKNMEDDHYAYLLTHNLVVYFVGKNRDVIVSEKQTKIGKKRIVMVAPPDGDLVKRKKFNKARVYADRMVHHRKSVKDMCSLQNAVYPGMYPTKICRHEYHSKL